MAWEQFKSPDNRWSWDGIFEHYYTVEGGYVNNSDDLGGETGSGGITKSLLDDYEYLWPKYDFTGDMTAVPIDLVKEIYRLEFWDTMRLDDVWEICPALADAMYGWGLNSGCSRPVLVLQKHVTVMNKKGTLYPNITADGITGDKTIEALYSYSNLFAGKKGILKLIRSVVFAQQTFYIDISYSRSNEENETFTDGWLNRVDEKISSYIEFSELIDSDTVVTPPKRDTGAQGALQFEIKRRQVHRDKPLLKMGSKGDSVRVLQSDLNLLGAGLAVDGIYGNDTSIIISRLQSAYNLSIDGMCGDDTWNVILYKIK